MFHSEYSGVHSALLAAAVLGATMLGGCKKATPTGTVSGVVTYEGKPVAEGVIQFINPSTGGGGNAKISSDGKYTLEAPLEVGKYVVVITPPTIDDLPGGAGDPAKMEKPKNYPDIPEGYRSQERTDLEVTVAEGTNDIPLNMKKGGGKPLNDDPAMAP